MKKSLEMCKWKNLLGENGEAEILHEEDTLSRV